jgi:PAS domain S-box-containing protein
VAPRHARLARIHPALDLGIFRQMADLSNDAFYLTDSAGRFLYVNERAATLGGYSRAELLRMSVSDINPEYPIARFREFVAAMQDGATPPFETISRAKDGRLFPIEISVARFELGGEIYLFGVVRDITERKQLEAARKSFAQRMLQTLEVERQRVARELHDDVGQAVATVAILLHSLEQASRGSGDEARATLAAIRESTRQITEAVARIVRDYHPAELLGGGLEETLRAHVCQFAQRHNLTLQLTTVPVAGLLSPEHELHLYRIVQEALANVARHARARRVGVSMRRRGRQLVVVVRDDGVGFDPARAVSAAGFGLVTMRERAELMGATLAFRRLPRGTEVRLAVPLPGAARPPRAPRSPRRRRRIPGEPRGSRLRVTRARRRPRRRLRLV